MTDSYSLSLGVGGPSAIGAYIEEDTNVFNVRSEVEFNALYRFYGGRKAPTGGYGILGVGVYNADTNGGNLTLFRFFGGGGYKWMPFRHFSFSFQGGLGLGNEDEVTAKDSMGFNSETISVGPFNLFLSVLLGIPF
jgi:hypothetical protein